ncbi:MAG: Sodium/proton antiporter [Candidatus Wolfebacteria bacterium GW2011_GWA2_42_10]|uniref:Sodium/proton antiporter n=2 Tax=Candidatus Wolfeibacteriota TaxID=1752735 RepID=A0A0G1AJ55_9BACT|nr:MAG: Sodium/proton antiporter [Candidatus Wolfebacteria bacterium GW2011_GWB1_41_12]KKS25323.1 MAG: Sodium/proton antiporter [Candidatus Wolfebacteria bacterium GW2011_GWA2_42_10]KKT56762.1 MAG: Sodium/proton antiporter [Candidatus Wolfebacteria bacterium GW2011_GWA1_44_24]
MDQNDKNNNYLLPISIIVAALLIAGAWIYTAGLKNVGNGKTPEKPAETSLNIENVAAVNSNDHIRGNLEAEVKIVEFSDLECPFCKSFHSTMKQVMEGYGDKVAWIYRHYPIDQLHPKARTSAVASECAAELGGNEKFWAYVDRYFEITPSNNQIDLAELPQIAQDIGLNRVQFENCLNSGRHQQLIEEQIQDALNSGARGTPYSIVISKDGKKYPISGAYSFNDVNLIINEALK